MKKPLLTIAALLCAATGALADEGMWILSLLSRHNIDVMKQEGCRLTPEQIYSVNNSSIKD
ncbi:MAG: S46 family peptidase, partial [Bacteroidales bacterium]|nr:S46 family peptidase [Bacteroidales bacterium]